LLWTAQPVYLSMCAPDASVIGKYSGIFFSLFQSATILGNILSGAIMSSNISRENLIWLLASISFCGSIIMLLLRNPKPPTIGFNLTDSLEFISPTKPLPSPKAKPTSLSIFKQTMKLSITKKMFWLHPLFIHQGISNAIFFGSFPLQMPEKIIGFALATLGVAEVVGSVFLGKGV